MEFLDTQLGIKTPRVTSLRALYPRRPTLYEHQRLAQAQLKFRALMDRAERQLVAHLRRIWRATTDSNELLGGARQWLDECRYLIVGERRLLDLCHHVINNDEIQLAKEFNKPFTESASFQGLDLLKLKEDEWE